LTPLQINSEKKTQFPKSYTSPQIVKKLSTLQSREQENGKKNQKAIQSHKGKFILMQ